MAAYEAKPLIQDDDEDLNRHEEATGCGCFRVFGSGCWRRGSPDDGDRGSCVGEKLRKMKEVSELIAGPKWKTFIRKISGSNKKQQKNRFQYDEHSYALNFNSGANSDDDAGMPPSFSARFTAPLAPPRSSTT